MATELFKIEVVDDDRFDVGIAFGGNGVAGEFDVGRREDARLGVVDVGVLDERQIARTTGDGHDTGDSRRSGPWHNGERADSRDACRY